MNIQLKQPLTSTSSATDSIATICKVQNVDTTQMVADVVDQIGTHRKVTLKVLPGKQPAYPAAGEDWIISREYGDWIFVAAVNVPLATAPQGPQGPQGVQGPQGAQGQLGVNPTGTIQMFGGTVAPSGWLICDGSAVSRSTQAGLFAVIGTNYGPGDGATTFNLPNFASSFPMGATPGSVGGAATHAHPLSGAGWAQIVMVNPGSIGVAGRREAVPDSWDESFRITGTTTTPQSAQTNATPLAGATDSGSSLPPYVGVNFIIKT